MKIKHLVIPDVVLVEPQIFEDSRGLFFESFNHRKFEHLINRKLEFVQDNHSISRKNVVRGLHFQQNHPQAKLVRVIRGEIFDVAVDLRKNSATYGQWVAEYLSASNKKQLWIPEGFAHGFLALTDNVEVLYKTNEYWVADDEKCIIWNDKTLDIDWPIDDLNQVIVSDKDMMGVAFGVKESV